MRRRPPGGRRPPIAVLGLVRLASLLVPAGLRAEWLREWAAELSAASAAGRPVLRPALGGFRHGIWLRWEECTVGARRRLWDLRFAARALRRRPAFALTAVATLAIGIGASTAVYTVVDRVLLAPLPYPGSERFVRVEAAYTPFELDGISLNVELFTEWKARARTLEVMEGYALSPEGAGANLVAAGPPAVVKRAQVTGGFLPELLGVRPVAGRLFGPTEHTQGADDVTLISERLWRARFGGSPGAVGTTVRVDGRPTTVVGVVPTVALLPEVDLWTPHLLATDFARSRLGGITTIARLAPGVSLDEALADLRRAEEETGEAHPGFLASFAPRVADYRSMLVSDVRTHLLLLMGAVGALLLIA